MHLTPDVLERLPVPRIEEAISAVKALIEELKKTE